MSYEPAPRRKSGPSLSSTQPTAAQLTELEGSLVTAAELLRVYAGLSRNPRVQAMPDATEIFATCREQMRHDLMLLDEQIAAFSGTVVEISKNSDETDAEGSVPLPPGLAALPDIEPPDPKGSVFEMVSRAFHLEDYLGQQISISMRSAKERGHLKLELQLKMMLLSIGQRRSLLEQRYGFARTQNLIFRGLRRQTTRFLSRLKGQPRPDLD